MAKMKFDFKQFVMQKGERVGLGLALGLMALLFVWGVLGAVGVSSPAKDLSQAADQLTSKVRGGQGTPGNGENIILPKISEWHPGVDAERLHMTPFFDPMGAGNPKRSSPIVLPLDYEMIDGNAGDGKKYPVLLGQIDVVYNGAKAFDVKGKRVFYHVATGAKNAGMGRGDNSGGFIGPQPGGKGGNTFGGPGGRKGGISTSDKKYVEVMKSMQMVVVSATFPVKQQLEQISKALRYNSLEEMFESGGIDALQEFGGLVVFRREFGADGKPGDWADLKLDDRNGPTMKLYALLKGFEPEDEEQLKHIFPGLVMPRPYSLTVEYPLVKLPEIPAGELHVKRIREEEKADRRIVGSVGPGPGGVGPGGAGPGGGKGGLGGGVGGVGQAQGPPKAKYTPLAQEFKELPKEYEGPEEATQEKFDGKFEIFEPGGFPREEGDDKAPAAKGGKGNYGDLQMKGGKGGKNPGDGAPVGPGFGDMMKGQAKGVGQPQERVAGPGPDKLPDKALVRFVDITVKPGHTYQYMIKVRLRNPNFKKKPHEIASVGLAKKQYLESPFVYTQAVRVGQEIHFYAVDQKLAEDPEHYRKHHMMKGTETGPAGGERVALQVHRFFKDVKDAKNFAREVSDWAVAERVLVPRGEYVGHPVEVELPYWNNQEEEFDLINGRTNVITKQKYGSVVVDFSTRGEPASMALVVDFRGGRSIYGVESSQPNRAQTDEAATELLILTKDLKLEVRHGRLDTDPQYPRAAERAARLEHMRQRAHDVKQPPAQMTNPFGGGKGGPGA